MNSDTVKRVLKMVFLLIVLFSNAKPAAAAFDYNAIMVPIQNVICGIYGVFIYIAATLAALVFLVAAVQWVASRDDPAKRKQAQTIMIHAIIGLIIVGIAAEIIKSTGLNICTKEGLPE